jgi:hypothetical protein
MRLALQLPAVKKLGEEVGINVAGGVRGLGAPLDSGGGDGGDGGSESGKEE